MQNQNLENGLDSFDPRYDNWGIPQTKQQFVTLLNQACSELPILEEFMGLKAADDPITFVLSCFYCSGNALESIGKPIFVHVIDQNSNEENVSFILNRYRQVVKPWLKDPDALYAKYGPEKIYDLFNEAGSRCGLTIDDLPQAGNEDQYERDLIYAGTALRKRILTIIMADLADDIVTMMSNGPKGCDLVYIDKLP